MSEAHRELGYDFKPQVFKTKGKVVDFDSQDFSSKGRTLTRYIVKDEHGNIYSTLSMKLAEDSAEAFRDHLPRWLFWNPTRFGRNLTLVKSI